MDDLVKWLRNKSSEHNMYRCDEAADRIEALEAALREIKGWNDNQDKRSLKIAAVIDSVFGGEKNYEQNQK